MSTIATRGAVRWAGLARVGLGVAAPVVLVVLLIGHWSTVDAGTDAMRRGDREWLATAAMAVVLTWAAGSCCQLGATTAVLPVGRVFATQVAGSFVNHVLPAGVGVAALNLRMLRRAGLSVPRAAGAVGLNAAAGFVVHALALVALLFVAGPRIDHVDRLRLGSITAAIFVAAAIGAALLHRIMRRGGSSFAARLASALAAGRVVLRNPGRAVLLWAGSAAVPTLHILTLTAVLHALHQPAPILTLAVVYLGASALAAIIPGPGGFGALDVALIAALAGSGMTTTTAATAVISYRLLTVWLPLFPGAATLLVLLHRRVI